MMETLVALIVIVAALFFAGRYIYRSKKSGVKCIGCPNGRNCGGKCCSTELNE